jgi:hypothetical protein
VLRQTASKLRKLWRKQSIVPSIRRCGLRGLRSSRFVDGTILSSRGPICGCCRRNSSPLNFSFLSSHLSTWGRRDQASHFCRVVPRSKRSSNSVKMRSRKRTLACFRGTSSVSSIWWSTTTSRLATSRGLTCGCCYGNWFNYSIIMVLPGLPSLYWDHQFPSA